MCVVLRCEPDPSLPHASGAIVAFLVNFSAGGGTAVWRGTTPQHFDTGDPHGHFSGAANKAKTCTLMPEGANLKGAYSWLHERVLSDMCSLDAANTTYTCKHIDQTNHSYQTVRPGLRKEGRKMLVCLDRSPRRVEQGSPCILPGEP